MLPEVLCLDIRTDAVSKTYRLGEVDELAAAVCYFLSDLATYTTGHTLDVNGGLYMD